MTTPNTGGWYKRKWKAYIPTDKEAKWGLETWCALVVLIIVLFIFFLY